MRNSAEKIISTGALRLGVDFGELPREPRRLASLNHPAIVTILIAEKQDYPSRMGRTARGIGGYRPRHHFAGGAMRRSSSTKLKTNVM
jgi:hypothetical protein